MFLQPFANILLWPENDGADQAGLCWARVVYAIIVTGTVLQTDGETEEDGRVLEKESNHSGHLLIQFPADCEAAVTPEVRFIWFRPKTNYTQLHFQFWFFFLFTLNSNKWTMRSKHGVIHWTVFGDVILHHEDPTALYSSLCSTLMLLMCRRHLQ